MFVFHHDAMYMTQENSVIDQLVYDAVFAQGQQKADAAFKIWQMGIEQGVYFASINDFYLARGRGEIASDFTVPALNLRGMTYDMARSVLNVAVKNNTASIIFEIARSEMAYTQQSPQEYAIIVLAAAIKEGYTGPLFIQGDHFQAKAEKMGVIKDGEIDAIKALIVEAVQAGFYNIDIDMSTLVDLDKQEVIDQQEPNIRHSLELAQFVRSVEPANVTISLGGEIGHIGGINSTVEDFETFITGFNGGLPAGMTGISKISVATGTSHGGVVLADGTLAQVNLDFSILSDISKIGREKYGIGGAVQHGASTLPDDSFGKFPQSQAVEVHLATGLQNMLFDHSSFPKELLEKMYHWIDETKLSEKKETQTTQQFHYEQRKKAWGQFKQECWNIPEETKAVLRASLSQRFEFLFAQLNIFGNKQEVLRFVPPVQVEKNITDFSQGQVSAVHSTVTGLSD